MSGPARLPWLEAGFRLLKEEGHAALTLDRLCVATGKTKGSFYHHFPTLEACFEALLATWEEDMTQAPIRAVEASCGSEAQAARLEAEVIPLDHALDQAIRAWGQRIPLARAAVARVDALRIAFLTHLHQEAGHLAPDQLARLEYAAFLGMQQLGLCAAPDSPQLSALLRRALSHVGLPPPIPGKA